MTPMEDLRARYISAQLEGDRRAALRLVVDDGLAMGLTISELRSGIIQEAQREIGRLWQEDRITVAQEHVATAISHLALAQLYDRAAAPVPNGRRVVVACVEGEQHDFPARLVADALDLEGFDVRFLGANVPTDSLLALLVDETPDVVALSVTMAFNLPALRDATTRIRAALPNVLVAAGGLACVWSQSAAAQVGADITGASAAELVDAAKRALEQRS